MATTPKQRHRRRLSQHLRRLFGLQQDSQQLDTNNRQVELRKRQQFRQKKRAS